MQMEKLFSKNEDSSKRSKKIKKSKKHQDKSHLNASKFRYLNEYLYTNPSINAKEYFNANKSDFQMVG